MELISREQVIATIDSFNVFESRSDQIKLELMIGELPIAGVGTNLAEVGTDCISRQQAIDALYSVDEYNSRSVKAIKQLPPIHPEPHEIGYDDCTNALLKMWMDNVLTDGDYYRIADKLNKKWGKTELPESYTEPFKGVTT